MNKSTLLAVLVAVALPCSVSASKEFSWPGWRGADRTDISKETGLLKSWPEGGPKQLWIFKDAGIGYSGFSVVDGRLFTMGAADNKEFLICIDAEKGEELWSIEVGGLLTNGWGDGPRGTPTVDGELVYALSGQGNLICAEAADGKIRWQTSMKELGGGVPNWGYTESVLVDEDKVVCTPGGKSGAIAALNKYTGEPVWQSTEFTDGAQYASIIAADHNGGRQYIQLTQKSVVDLDATNGKVLWKTDWPGRVAVVPTPIFRDGKVYVSSGYGVGCKCVEIGPNNEVQEVFNNKNMKNHHGGVILIGDHLYGYSDGPGWTCQDFKTGEIVWHEKKLGKGAIAYADGRLYCLGERDGTVVLAEASPDGWKEHGRFVLEPQTELRKPKGKIWTHPVVVNGKLYLRDQELLYCYDVKQR